jgi:hypothetical protein
MFLWATILSGAALTSCESQTATNSKQESAKTDQQQEVAGTSPTDTNWDRMTQCATRVDQWTASVGLVEGQRQGNVVTLGRENHYSPKYGRCYLLVSYLHKGGKAAPPGEPLNYNELWDAFERKLLATCAGTQFGTSGFCSIEGEGVFECAACKQFIDDRMKR